MYNLFASALTITGVLASVGGALALLAGNPAVVLTPMIGTVLAVIGAVAIVCGTIHSALLQWQAADNACKLTMLRESKP